MAGVQRSSRTLLLLISGIICVWPTYAAPRPGVRALILAQPLSLKTSHARTLPRLRLKPLSAAQIRAATTPPTGNQIRTIINNRPGLRTAVVRAAATLGLNGAKFLTPRNPGPRTAPGASQGSAYPPSPCDFGSGVWLTLARPLAANAWPPTNWALLSVGGACVLLYPATGLQYPPLDTIEGDLSGGAQLTTILPSAESGVWVQFRPDQAGLYAVTLNTADAATAARFKAQANSPSIVACACPNSWNGETDLLSGTAVDSNKVLAIVKVRQQDMAAGHFALAWFNCSGDPWTFGGVKISRLSD